MKSFKYIILSALILLSAHISAQNMLFESPVRLNANLNSNAEESYPMLSRDGKHLYFARIFHDDNTGGKTSGFDIWVSKRADTNVWTVAENVSEPLNNKLNNFIVGFSKNGETAYLLNTYKGTKKSFLSKSVKVEGEWTDPEWVAMPDDLNIDQNYLGLYMHPNEKILLLSMKKSDSFGQEDLYVMTKDSLGNWQKPINLGSTINTNGYEIAPFLSDDGSKLYFSSNGHGGLGEADILMAERLYDTWNVWTNPVNLGKGINSPKFDAYFNMNEEGDAFFVSNRDSKFSDIFSTKVITVDSVQLKIQNILKDAERLIDTSNDSIN